MKVSELFAEIGFRVNKDGLKDFEKTLKSITKQINTALKGIEKLKNATNKVSSAVTKVNRSVSSSSSSSGNNNGGGFSLFLGSLSSFLGNLFSGIVNKLEKTLMKAFRYLISNIGSFVKTAFKDIMAYVSYRSFTGRNAAGVSDLMAMTAFTTSMRPQDILNDAKDLSKQYWDIFFGKASPEFFLRLGMLPTGNGQKDLRNILLSILNVTGGLKNRGLALSLLGQGGLNEEYMMILEKMAEGKSLPEVYKITDEQLDALQETNTQMRQFRQNLEQLQKDIISLWNNGLKDVLTFFLERLRALISLVQSGAFKGKGVIESGKMIMDVFTNSNPKAVEYMKGTGDYLEPANMTLWDKAKKYVGEPVEKISGVPGILLSNLANLLPGVDLSDFAMSTTEGLLRSRVAEDLNRRARESEVKISNYFDTRGQSSEFVGDLQNRVVGEVVNSEDLNFTNNAARTVFLGGR